MDALNFTGRVRLEADGKGVWSWSPDAGTKLRETGDVWRGDGGNKARFTEESTL